MLIPAYAPRGLGCGVGRFRSSKWRSLHSPEPAENISCHHMRFSNLQTLFTGTIAKAASLIAIVIGGYGFAHGEPGAKKALAGVAAGTGNRPCSST